MNQIERLNHEAALQAATEAKRAKRTAYKRRMRKEADTLFHVAAVEAKAGNHEQAAIAKAAAEKRLARL